jgi:hypothetical protein
MGHESRVVSREGSTTNIAILAHILCDSRLATRDFIVPPN